RRRGRRRERQAERGCFYRTEWAAESAVGGVVDAGVEAGGLGRAEAFELVVELGIAGLKFGEGEVGVEGAAVRGGGGVDGSGGALADGDGLAAADEGEDDGVIGLRGG